MNEKNELKRVKRAKYKVPEAMAMYKLANRIEKIERKLAYMYSKDSVNIDEYLKHRKKVATIFNNLEEVIAKIEKQFEGAACKFNQPNKPISPKLNFLTF